MAQLQAKTEELELASVKSSQAQAEEGQKDEERQKLQQEIATLRAESGNKARQAQAESDKARQLAEQTEAAKKGEHSCSYCGFQHVAPNLVRFLLQALSDTQAKLEEQTERASTLEQRVEALNDQCENVEASLSESQARREAAEARLVLLEKSLNERDGQQDEATETLKQEVLPAQLFPIQLDLVFD